MFFQMKGIRKIMHRKTTYVDREQSTKRVLKDLQEEIRRETKEGKDEKQVKPYSK